VRRRASILWGVAALLAGVAGCGGFSRADYETLHMGDTPAEVTAALGEPTTRVAPAGDGPAETWWVYDSEGARFYRAIIRLRDGKVVGKSWYDSRRACPPLPGE